MIGNEADLRYGRFLPLRAEVHGFRRLIVQRLMKPLRIVEPEVWPKVSNRIGRIGIVLQVNLFVLHGSPQPFDENIVQSSPPSIHADQDVLCLQPARESVAGELRSLVGVEDLWTTLPERPLQR